jgi:aminoglycoside phosphotransferase (APT) family kinase protein
MGVPVPTIRCSDGPSRDLDRAWRVMDFAIGQPLLAGLSAATALKTVLPTLLRRLPDLLADAAAELHQCPIYGLDGELTDHTRRPDIHDFLARIAAQADSTGRPDLALTAEHLAGAAHDADVICHGDLHRFNLLVDGDRWTLIDWSTAVLADPHDDLAFNTLTLATLPSANPRQSALQPVRSALDSQTGSCAATNTGPGAALTVPGSRGVAAPTRCARSSRLRPWEANDDLDAHRGHPRLTIRPVLEAQLGPVQSPWRTG